MSSGCNPYKSSYYSGGTSGCGNGCCYTTNTNGCAQTYPNTCDDMNGYVKSSGGVMSSDWTSSSDLPSKGSPALNYRQFVTPNTDATAWPSHLYTQACWDEDKFPSANGQTFNVDDACQAEFGPEYKHTAYDENYGDNSKKCSDISTNDFKNNVQHWNSGDTDDVLKTQSGSCLVVGNTGNRGCGNSARVAVCARSDPRGLDPTVADITGCCVEGKPWATSADQAVTGSRYATWLRCPTGSPYCLATASALPSPAQCPDCTESIANYIVNGVLDSNGVATGKGYDGQSPYNDSRVRAWIGTVCNSDLGGMDPNNPPAGYTADEISAAQLWCRTTCTDMSQNCYNTAFQGNPTCGDITTYNCDAFVNAQCQNVLAEQNFDTPSRCSAGGVDEYTLACLCSCVSSPMEAGMNSTESICYDPNCAAGGYIPSIQIGGGNCSIVSCTQNWNTVGQGNDSLNNQMQLTCDVDGDVTTDDGDTNGDTDGGDTDGDTGDTDDTGTPTWVIVLIILLVLFVAVAAIGGVIVLRGRTKKAPSAPISVSLA